MQIKLSSWYFTLIKKNVRYPKLHINATEIERTDHFNFLGLQLNHNLKCTYLFLNKELLKKKKKKKKKKII